MKNRVLLVKNLMTAKRLINEFENKNIPTATVEVEYGDECVEGSHATLAHHVPQYIHLPAPCVRDEIPQMNNGVILISHLDLDTLGGIQILEGCKIKHQTFWNSEFLIDTKGYRGHKLIPEDDSTIMKSYWGWELKQELDFEKLTMFEQDFLDVTKLIEKRIEHINLLLKSPIDSNLIQLGLLEFKKRFQLFMNGMIFENDTIRIFITEEPQHYLSHENGLQTVRTCITLNQTRGNIIISDITENLNCKEVMQSVFGEKAGGQYRVAGTPRNEKMNKNDIFTLCEYLKSRLGFEIDLNELNKKLTIN